MSNAINQDPPRRGSLLVIFLTVFVDLLGFGIVLPLLPIYGEQFAQTHGFSRAQSGWIVGLLMASFSAMQFLFVPIWGRLSDRVGRRPVLIVGLAGSTFFYAMFGLATAQASLIGLFITRIGAGIAGATIATAQAYIADTTTRENRAKGMALVGAAFALGFTLGPMVGGVSLLAGGQVNISPWPGYFAAGLSAIALALAIFKLPESLRPDSASAGRSLLDTRALGSALATPSIGLLLATLFLSIFCFANFESTLSLQIERIISIQDTSASPPASTLLSSLVERVRGWGYSNPKDIRLIIVYLAFTYLGLVLTLAQGVLVRRLAGRISEAAMAATGAILAIVGFVFLARAAHDASFSELMWAMPIEVVGFSLVSPSLQSLISRRSDPAQQGGILGLAQSAASLARILGPVFGMRLFASAADWPYWAAAVLLAPGLVMIVASARRGRDFVSAS